MFPGPGSAELPFIGPKGLIHQAHHCVSLHLSGGRDLLHALVGSVSDDGRDETLVGCHGDGYVDGVEGAGPVARPRHVDFRHLLGGKEGLKGQLKCTVQWLGRRPQPEHS